MKKIMSWDSEPPISPPNSYWQDPEKCPKCNQLWDWCDCRDKEEMEVKMPENEVKEMEYLNKVFRHHPPQGTQSGKYLALRDSGKYVAALIFRHCPDSRERSLALTKLEEAIMWANASIARNEVVCSSNSLPVLPFTKETMPDKGT